MSEGPPPESAASPPARLAAGTQLAGRYRLEQVIGAGGMATVWRALDEVLGRPVAIKVMSDSLAADPAYVTRFAQEARTAARISHPNLVQIYDYGALTPQPFLVMEHIDGGTLAQRARRGPLGGDELRLLARDLLSAIASVHAAGVLHRDIKPANVLLGSDGRARLTDFGIARLEDSTRLTQPGHVVGTLRYLAPELIEGAPASKRSDLYALGVLLREIAPQELSDPALLAVIEQLTADAPAERPADASEVLRRLEGDPQGPPSAIATLEAPTRTARPPFQVHATRSWSRVAAVAGSLALVLVLVLVLAAGGGSTAGDRARAARRAGASSTHSTARISSTSPPRDTSNRSARSTGAGQLEQRLTQLADGVRAATR